MVDDTDNEMEYIKTNPFNLEWTLTIRVTQEDEHHGALVNDLVQSFRGAISPNELTNWKKEEDGNGKKELLGMLEIQDDSKLGIMSITNKPPPSHSPGWTLKQADRDFNTHNEEELDQAHADIHSIALMEQDGVNNPDAQAYMYEMTAIVIVDWWVTVLVRVVTARAVELLSELSCCERCCQSCCQSYCHSCCHSCCKSHCQSPCLSCCQSWCQSSARCQSGWQNVAYC